MRWKSTCKLCMQWWKVEVKSFFSPVLQPSQLWMTWYIENTVDSSLGLRIVNWDRWISLLITWIYAYIDAWSKVCIKWCGEKDEILMKKKNPSLALIITHRGSDRDCINVSMLGIVRIKMTYYSGPWWIHVNHHTVVRLKVPCISVHLHPKSPQKWNQKTSHAASISNPKYDKSA